MSYFLIAQMTDSAESRKQTGARQVGRGSYATLAEAESIARQMVAYGKRGGSWILRVTVYEEQYPQALEISTFYR